MGGSKAAVSASNILGIAAYYHDSAAALLKDGELAAAAQQERFSRRKHDARFPADAIRYCLETQNLRLNELDRIVFYDKPLIKFERLLAQEVLARADNRRNGTARRSDRIHAGFVARTVHLHPVLKKIPAASCGYFNEPWVLSFATLP